MGFYRRKIVLYFLVYLLYGLTYDEVLVVDPQTPITREEYETFLTRHRWRRRVSVSRVMSKQ